MKAQEAIQASEYDAATRDYAHGYTMKIEENADPRTGGYLFTCWDGLMPPFSTEIYASYEAWAEANPVEAAADDWEPDLGEGE